MKERPILFSAPMVSAILEGWKTQTRRMIKPQPYIDENGSFIWNGWNYGYDFNGPHVQAIAAPMPSSKTKRVLCPYGQPGDRLWVREKWAKTRIAQCPGLGEIFVYDACDNRTDYGGPWKPSIHMPRLASRILLEIVSVRVERLQDISEADAKAEGVTYEPMIHSGYVGAFCDLWSSINCRASWDANPWVWVVEFRRVIS